MRILINRVPFFLFWWRAKDATIKNGICTTLNSKSEEVQNQLLPISKWLIITLKHAPIGALLLFCLYILGISKIQAIGLFLCSVFYFLYNFFIFKNENKNIYYYVVAIAVALILLTLFNFSLSRYLVASVQYIFILHFSLKLYQNVKVQKIYQVANLSGIFVLIEKNITVITDELIKMVCIVVAVIGFIASSFYFYQDYKISKQSKAALQKVEQLKKVEENKSVKTTIAPRKLSEAESAALKRFGGQ